MEKIDDGDGNGLVAERLDDHPTMDCETQRASGTHQVIARIAGLGHPGGTSLDDQRRGRASRQ